MTYRGTECPGHRVYPCWKSFPSRAGFICFLDGQVCSIRPVPFILAECERNEDRGIKRGMVRKEMIGTPGPTAAIRSGTGRDFSRGYRGDTDLRYRILSFSFHQRAFRNGEGHYLVIGADDDSTIEPAIRSSAHFPGSEKVPCARDGLYGGQRYLRDRGRDGCAGRSYRDNSWLSLI